MSIDPQSPSQRPHPLKNWVSLSGAVIAFGSCFAFLLLFAIDLFARQGNPYMGILTYVVAPAFLILGLFLMGLGAWIQRRHSRKPAPSPRVHSVTIDLSRSRDRRGLAGFVIGSVIFLLCTALGSYRTYHYTESVQFCGQACHTPMNPEFTAYQNSPHARVACAECHVGPGAAGFLKAKINGVHQLYCTLTGNYQRPIKTPVKNLPLTQSTCEQCHWPNKFVGNLDRTYAHFLADETNTPFTVRLLLKVGGGDPAHGPVGGIHWHMNLSNKVEYAAADERRQIIPWVRVTTPQGVVTEYRDTKFTNDISQLPVRTMDCMDCHNRPAHQFRSPNDAVDLSMSVGRIDAGLPWVKSNVVAVLTQAYQTEAEATAKISDALRSRHPNYAKLDSLVAEVQQIYRNNFFPEMKVDWRAYPNNLNHKDWAGCFRCHDGSHKSADGKSSIKASDCNTCHIILAQGSGAQLDQLNPKGHSFFHIDAVNEDFSCSECHTGAFPK
jgi:nitrate/TMAO reductase-like tetraheme cytochrome c subunit